MNKTMAIIIIGCSYVFNSYLLVLGLAFFDSLWHFITAYGMHGLAWVHLTMIGFSLTTGLVLLGLIDLPILARIATASRQPLIAEKEQLTRALAEIKPKIDVSRLKYLYIADGLNAEVSAYGRATIIVERVVLESCSDEEIKALLVHAMCQLRDRASLWLLCLFWLNLPVIVIMWLYRKYAKLSLIISHQFNKSLWSILTLIPLILFAPVIGLNFVGKVIFGWSFGLVNRSFIYAIDKSVVQYGFGAGLLDFLNKQLRLEERQKFMTELFSPQPSITKRLLKLEKFMQK